MGLGWTDKSDYKRLSGQLAAATGRDFERLILPLIRLRWHDAIAPAPLGEFDRLGVDLLAWSDHRRHRLVVQAKAFKVEEQELGESQIRQCLKSIAKFSRSALKCDLYLLVHNRDARSQEFRDRIVPELSRLRESGQVGDAHLIDRQKLLQESFEAMYLQLRTALVTRSEAEIAAARSYEPELCVPLINTTAPFRLKILGGPCR